MPNMDWERRRGLLRQIRLCASTPPSCEQTNNANGSAIVPADNGLSECSPEKEGPRSYESGGLKTQEEMFHMAVMAEPQKQLYTKLLRVKVAGVLQQLRAL